MAVQSQPVQCASTVRHVVSEIMGLFDDLNELLEPSKDAPRVAQATPANIPIPRDWTPGIVRDDNGGEVSTGPIEGEPDWDEIFKIWNLDPETWEVVDGSIQVRA